MKTPKRTRPNQLNLRVTDKARVCLRRMADKRDSTLTEALDHAIRETARREGVYRPHEEHG